MRGTVTRHNILIPRVSIEKWFGPGILKHEWQNKDTRYINHREWIAKFSNWLIMTWNYSKKTLVMEWSRYFCPKINSTQIPIHHLCPVIGNMVQCWVDHTCVTAHEIHVLCSYIFGEQKLKSNGLTGHLLKWRPNTTGLGKIVCWWANSENQQVQGIFFEFNISHLLIVFSNLEKKLATLWGKHTHFKARICKSAEWVDKDQVFLSFSSIYHTPFHCYLAAVLRLRQTNVYQHLPQAGINRNESECEAKLKKMPISV